MKTGAACTLRRSWQPRQRLKFRQAWPRAWPPGATSSRLSWRSRMRAGTLTSTRKLHEFPTYDSILCPQARRYHTPWMLHKAIRLPVHLGRRLAMLVVLPCGARQLPSEATCTIARGNLKSSKDTLGHVSFVVAGTAKLCWMIWQRRAWQTRPTQRS